MGRHITLLMGVLALASLVLAAACFMFESQLDAGEPLPLTATSNRDGAEAIDAAEHVRRGAYLARLGNCVGCHTTPGGALYAGSHAVATPFGPVMAGNLTPDVETGLGLWTANDFWLALRLGRSRDGRMLMPAFPYPYYSGVTRSDSDALFAYLRSLPAVFSPRQPHGVRFPYNTQAALSVWRLLAFRPAEPSAELQPGSVLQRGAYLVQGWGHCGACHAPRNAWGASAQALSGGDMPGHRWHAPSLLPQGNAMDSNGVQQTVALLKTGGSALGRASGPMAAVVGSSMQYWTDADLQAAVLYLQSLPPAAQHQVQGSAGLASSDKLRQPRGAELYDQHCADCHGREGEGVVGIYPALAGNATVLQPTALNLVQIIAHGGFGPTTAGNPRPFGMPLLVLDNAAMAAVVNHVRQSWGNSAAGVSELDVLRLR